MSKKAYCNSLDRFVLVRVLDDSDIDALFSDSLNIPSKRYFYNMVITACVVDYLANIVGIIEGNKSFSAISDIIHEELYEICININPGLNIRNIRFDDKKLDKIPMLGVDDAKYDFHCEDLENRLKEQIIGQDEAVHRITNSIKRAAVGLKDSKRPIGSFSFVGQTGIGKTELARALTKCLFGPDEENLLKIDCSEYSQSHEYSKLIGAPPGYIGHNDGGHLAEFMKSKSKAVILFDEIEKAHTKVHNILLQIMEDGVVTDSKGHRIKFQDSVIIMTSNVGVSKIRELNHGIGFNREKIEDHQTVRQETIKDFEKQFRPEFINRIDEIIVFRALTYEDKIRVVEKLLNETLYRAANIGIQLIYDKCLSEFIVDTNSDDQYGMRPFRRAIEKLIEVPLADNILSHRVNRQDRVRVYVKSNAIKLKRD